MKIAARVALRFFVRLALRRDRLAASIPARWFAEQSRRLKAILKQPLEGGLEHWSGKVEAALSGFFDAFERDFAEVAPSHADAVAAFVREAKRDLRLSLIPWWDLESFRNRYLFDPSGRGIAEELRHAGGWACLDRIQDSVKTVADLFKTSFSVTDADVLATVQKVLRQAKPGSPPSDLLNAVRSLAPKAVAKQKASWSPAGWVDSVRESLSKAWVPEPFSTFDINGLRVVFEGSLPDAEVTAYTKSVLEAHRALHQKRLSKAWYGELFICRGCDSGAAGAYQTGPDTVRLYAPPGSRATYTILHELGHRYWFKSMGRAQRGRFGELVKAHTVHQPNAAPPLLMVMHFTDRDIAQGHHAVDRFDARFQLLLGKLEVSTNPDELSGALRGAIRDLEKDLRRFTALVGDDKILSGPALDVHNAYAVPLSRARLALEEAISAGDWAAVDEGALGSIVAAAHAWVDAAAQAFNLIADRQLEGLEGGKEWLDSYLDNESPVVPVSAYGKTNIDEAFAEVFAHYVLEFDITRAQLESFRSVLASSCSSGIARPSAAHRAPRSELDGSRETRAARSGG